ncbi:hypothetical protein CBL_10726 [Carabus blaptoides fortunei]
MTHKLFTRGSIESAKTQTPSTKWGRMQKIIHSHINSNGGGSVLLCHQVCKFSHEYHQHHPSLQYPHHGTQHGTRQQAWPIGLLLVEIRDCVQLYNIPGHFSPRTENWEVCCRFPGRPSLIRAQPRNQAWIKEGSQ